MNLFLGLFTLVVLSSFVHTTKGEEDDFYKLLNVPRDATVKEIRKAFKTLAVKFHPDKNKEDENADEKFVKIAKAYEILKDPDTRKEYDLHGYRGDGNDQNKKYHSYSYYRDHFGIYDDDPLIVTLSKADYELNVLDDNQAWFVNFYSPNCHHCHELAPTWRKLASELEGVVRVAAVNCEDDWSLCYQLSIEAYPTLLYYEKEAHLYEGQRYRGSRTLSVLQDYVLSKITVQIETVTPELWKELKDQDRNEKWLLLLCPDDNVNCPERNTQIKLAATLDGLVRVGLINDESLASEVYESYKLNPIVFADSSKVQPVSGSDSKEIVENVLNLLPNPTLVDEEKFKQIRTGLREPSTTEKPWLICFYLGPATELNLLLKRLPAVVPNLNIGLMHCARSASLCGALHVSRYPTWGVLKVGGAFELHHGRDVLYEVAAFARDSVKSTNLHAISPADFDGSVKEGGPWFVDWYAPWCPPCKRLLPEIRKASQRFEPSQIKFGTVDCTLHRQLCHDEGITSYPTTKFYNGSDVQLFHGVPNEDGIVEFVTDVLHPLVITLDEGTFVQLMRKPESELWVVDFYAPWCGPCKKLSGEWRKLAKSVSDLPQIKVAQLDCVANGDLCEAQNVRGYPTIRLYPINSKGLNTVAIYNGNRDVVSLKRWILAFLPSPVEALSAAQFEQKILSKSYVIPWLVDFYAPWCGHCVHFEPEYRIVAKKLEGVVRCVKVDCEAERVFCGYNHVNAYPTLRLYFSPKEYYEVNAQEANEVVRKVKNLIDGKRNVHDEL